jgi:alpha-1,6-mannosyltransferase
VVLPFAGETFAASPECFANKSLRALRVLRSHLIFQVKLCDITQFWSPVSGGVRRYVSEKVKHWRALGGRHLLIIPGEKDAVMGDESARIYTIASPRISKETGYRVLLRLGEIGRILEAERPDLVENADPYQVGWRVARDCRRLKIPAVAFYHSHFAESELRPLEKWLGSTIADLLVDLAARSCRGLYNRYTTTLVPSPILAEVLRSWGVANTEVVDMGVDTDAFRPGCELKSDVQRRIGVPEDARVLLYVGRLAAEKNTANLCVAMSELVQRAPGAYHLIVAGEGIQRTAVQRVQRDTKAVTWLPFQNDHTRLLDLYHAADLFVHPGVKETFGLVATEAQACELPVVGIRGTAMDRVIGHDLSFWANENTPAALANAIERAFERDLPALGKAARVTTTARFSWKKVFARQFDLYRKVIQKGVTA